mgnify:CR=1 FL=1
MALFKIRRDYRDGRGRATQADIYVDAVDAAAALVAVQTASQLDGVVVANDTWTPAVPVSSVPAGEGVLDAKP